MRLQAFRARRAVRCASCKVVKGPRPVDEVGGPRTQQCGDTKHSVKAPSTWRRWELQADKTVACGTQAFPACEAAAARQLAVCCSTSTRCHVPGKHMMPRGHPRGAAGAVKRPVFRTPLRGRRNKATGEPRAGDDRGAMTRVWSPAETRTLTSTLTLLCPKSRREAKQSDLAIISGD